MKNLVIYFICFTTILNISKAQTNTDTLKIVRLDEFVIRAIRENNQITKLPLVKNTFIINGIKNSVIQIDNQATNFSDKIGRQIFAKIPGTFVYDMDGSGNQINIANRGLDPHRSWEFNIRQNGVIINSDIYGYPASHYSAPLESIQRVELVKGTASMQYGAEFGGMVNYITKTGDTTKRVSFESINTVASYGVASTYNAMGGKVGKLTYYGYIFNRSADGYRQNSKSKSNAQFLSLNYDFNSKASLKTELGRSTYLYQIPGPLTDSMFQANPRMSTRARNYFSPELYIPSLNFSYNFSKDFQLNWIVSGVFGTRNSVQIDAFANIPDVIDPATNQYKNRIVDIDKFNSKTTELRVLKNYFIGNFKNTMTVGIRYFNNDLNRLQRGKGTTGTDYDLSIIGDWGRNLHFKSQSIAVAIENMIYLNKDFTVAAGFRYENGTSNMTGTILSLDPAGIPNTIQHSVPVLGINAKYKLKKMDINAGFSQAYRPVLFKDIIPGSVLEKANKDLKNAYGYNAELGISGQIIEGLKYDLTGFFMQYNNRLGNFVINENGQNLIYKTNIGNSNTSGIEALIEWNTKLSHHLFLTIFTSDSYMKGVYQNAAIANGASNQDISGNEIESVPHIISRNGLNIYYRSFVASFLGSYVDQSFSDPTNVVTPTANGAKGLVPSYFIADLNFSYKLNRNIKFKCGINNLGNLSYFTKRPLFYPGPGIWSSDGRSFNFTIEAKI